MSAAMKEVEHQEKKIDRVSLNNKSALSSNNGRRASEIFHTSQNSPDQNSLAIPVHLLNGSSSDGVLVYEKPIGTYPGGKRPKPPHESYRVGRDGPVPDFVIRNYF